MQDFMEGRSAARLLRTYKNLVGYKVRSGLSLEQAKLEEEHFRVTAGIPDIDEPEQYFIDWVNNLLD